MNEETKHLVKLVKAMRDKQKEYFKSRNNFVLNEARDLERKVDMLIDQLESPGLFDQPKIN